jgi:hypothetical protein
MDQKKINLFLKKNQKILNNLKYSKKKSIILIDRSRYLQAIESSVVAAALANALKFNLYIFTDSLKENIIKIYKKFGIKKFYYIFSYNFFFKEIKLFFLSFLNLINLIIKLNLNSKKFEWLINESKINGYKIGDLIYDTYVRSNNSFLKPKIDLKFLKILFSSIFRLLKIEQLIDTIKPKLIICCTEAYANNEGITIRIALKKNIKVLRVHSQPDSISLEKCSKEKIFCGDKNLIANGISKRDLNKIKLNANIEKKILDRFKGIDTLHTGRVCLSFANKLKKKINKYSLFKSLKIDKSKKNFKYIALFAPHAFSDSPHLLGKKFFFRDYYQQFVETIKFINNLKNDSDVLWLIRPHPTSKLYNEDDVVKNFMCGLKLKKNVHYCPSTVCNTIDLLKICDVVITGRGTIGLEFAAFKKKTIIGGAGIYSGLGVVNEPRNKFEYFKMIRNFKKLSNTSLSEAKFAKKVLYYLEYIYPHNFKKQNNYYLSKKKSKIITPEIFLESVNNENRIFSNKLINNLKKFSFRNDNFYKFFFNNAKKITM